MTKKGSLDFLLLIYYIESRRRLQTKHGERIWNVSIMNAYNSLNPNHVFIDYYTDEQSEGKKIPVIQKVTLLPFLPSFSYTYKF